jgi:hypothetical protein
MRFTSFLALACLGLSATFVGCKKNTANKTTCSSTLHGFAADSIGMGSIGTCNHITINSATGYATSSGTFNGNATFDYQAAYNTSDGNYYVFKTQNSLDPSPILYKIDGSGTVTSLTPVSSSYHSSINYSQHDNKLYCFKDHAIAEVTISGSTFSATTVCVPLHSLVNDPFGAGAMTIDHSTGDIYYRTQTGSTGYVERYHPGTSSPTVVPTVTDSLFGLRFNNSDSKLYAIKSNGVDFRFVKIDPASGALTTFAILNADVNMDFFSAVIDPCSNRYVFSSLINISPLVSVLYQVDMTGTVVQHDTTASFYQGLTVQY